MAASARKRRLTDALTAAEVEELVREAQADVNECMISPMWGAMNPGATWRHLNRFVQVMGLATRGAAYSKLLGTSLGVPGGLWALMYFNSQFGWLGDLIWSALFGVLIGIISAGYFGYKSAFCRITVDEHRDYVDVDQVTNQVTAWADRLAHYYSKAWRGDNEANGIANPSSALYYQTCDRVEMLAEGDKVILPDGTEINGPQLLVYPARKVDRFREMKDYQGLTPQFFDVGGNAGRDRRATRRVFAKPGQGMDDYEKGKSNFVQNNLVWLYSMACIAMAGFIVMVLAG